MKTKAYNSRNLKKMSAGGMYGAAAQTVGGIVNNADPGNEYGERSALGNIGGRLATLAPLASVAPPFGAAAAVVGATVWGLLDTKSQKSKADKLREQSRIDKIRMSQDFTAADYTNDSSRYKGSDRDYFALGGVYNQSSPPTRKDSTTLYKLNQDVVKAGNRVWAKSQKGNLKPTLFKTDKEKEAFARTYMGTEYMLGENTPPQGYAMDALAKKSGIKPIGFYQLPETELPYYPKPKGLIKPKEAFKPQPKLGNDPGFMYEDGNVIAPSTDIPKAPIPIMVPTNEYYAPGQSTQERHNSFLKNDSTRRTTMRSKSMANGGQIESVGDGVVFNGPSHSEGGIQLPAAEVEGGETMDSENYVFSERLGFAKQHKRLLKATESLEGMPQTTDRQGTAMMIKRKEGLLRMSQEMVRNQLGIETDDKVMAMGGYKPKANGLPWAPPNYLIDGPDSSFVPSGLDMGAISSTMGVGQLPSRPGGPPVKGDTRIPFLQRLDFTDSDVDTAVSLGSNVANAFRVPPMVPKPAMDIPITLPKVSMDADRAEVVRQTRGAQLSADAELNSEQAASVRGGSTAQSLQAMSRISQAENNSNAQIGAQQSIANSRILMSNNAKTDGYNFQNVERTIAQQNFNQGNLTNALDKVAQARTDKALREQDATKFAIMSNVFRESGVGERMLDRVIQEIESTSPEQAKQLRALRKNMSTASKQ